ncbi:MAG TPA: hypothetical protein V6C57_06095 [Coleofasciculaceae cyanobacterium]
MAEIERSDCGQLAHVSQTLTRQTVAELKPRSTSGLVIYLADNKF